MNTFTAIAAPSHIMTSPVVGATSSMQRPGDEQLGIRKNPFWHNFLVALGVSTILNVFIGLTTNWFGEGSFGASLANLSYGMAIALSLYLGCAYLNSWLTGVVDWLNQPWRAFGITLISNITSVIFTRYLLQLIWFPLGFGFELREAMLAFHPLDYSLSLVIALFITAIYQGAYFLSIWKRAAVESEQLKTATVSAQYAALNAQVNPHFLFNSLNVLSALIKTDADAADHFVRGLSDVYRYVLDVRRESLVPLQREVELLRSYGELLTTRFGERMRLDVQLSPKQYTGQVVPLSLQMLVENAVKHNGATRSRPLTITVRRVGDVLHIHNNRVPLYEPADARGVGLDNIRERYRLAANADIDVVETEKSFEVRLPVVNIETQHS